MADDADEGYASLDAEDFAILGMVVHTDEGNDKAGADEANSCDGKTPQAAEAAAASRATAGASIAGRAPTGGKKRVHPESHEPSKPAKRKGTGFIDLSGIPPQPLILKNQVSATSYQDNSRRRPIGEGSSKFTGAFYKKKMQKWEARIMVQGKARFIGYYDKEEDAAADYARAAFKYKPKKPSPQTYGGLDLSGVPNDLPLIRKEGNATGYAGVTPNKTRFQAYIFIDSKHKTLGTFDTAEEAALTHARAKYYMDQNELSKPKDTPFIDLTGVPPQPLILKNQLSATCYQDNSRRRPMREGSSKYTGVYYSKESKKWRAQIMVQGKARFIGYYDKEEDAAADYARAAFKYKPKKPSPQTYGGLDLSGVPNDLPLIRKEGNATGYAGVTPNKTRFQAYIFIDSKHKTLGTFDTAEEAALTHARAKYYMDQNELSKPKDTPFIDLTGVPPQPLILKNQLSATCYQDNSRRRPMREGSSKYTGVYYSKESKKWRAQIMVQRKVRFIGYYDKEEDAAADYARAAFKYKPTKPSPQTYGGLDLSGVPEKLPLIRTERGVTKGRLGVTGYKGVKPMKGRFQVRISIGGGEAAKTLGTFDTAEEAALIYARAQYYLDQNGRSQDKKKESAVAELRSEEKSKADSRDGGDVDDNLGPDDVDEADEDPVDSCFIDSAGDKVDGVAV